VSTVETQQGTPGKNGLTGKYFSPLRMNVGESSDVTTSGMWTWEGWHGGSDSNAFTYRLQIGVTGTEDDPIINVIETYAQTTSAGIGLDVTTFTYSRDGLVSFTKYATGRTYMRCDPQ
jgi:hypothetical protein